MNVKMPKKDFLQFIIVTIGSFIVSVARIVFEQIHYFWSMKNEFLVKSGEKEYRLNLNKESGLSGDLDGSAFNLDIIETDTGYHILRDGKGYSIEVVSLDRSKKQVELKINHKYYSYEVKDKFDELLEQLGMDASSSGKVSEIKAPMPGLVLDVMVNVGEEVKEDQPLLILEAMKMENVIKSPTASSVKKVSVNKGDSVEKNHILIEFN